LNFLCVIESSPSDDSGHQSQALNIIGTDAVVSM